MSFDATDNLEIRLRRHPPERLVSRDDYEFVDLPIPEPRDGQVLIRSIYFSVDAGSRAMLDREGYVMNLRPGDAVSSSTIGEVVASRCEGYAPGDLIHCVSRWSRYAAIWPVRQGVRCYKINPKAPLAAYNGMFGFTGFTAFLGFDLIGRPKPGETVVISAAAGAVGLAAGQIAKLSGARVIGIAGGAEKCGFVVSDAGFDACVDYKQPDLEAALRAACPDGIDVYFENVGGAVQRAVLPLMNTFGRIPLCGQIAQYGAEAEVGPNWFPLTLKRMRVEGFLASDHFDRLQAFIAEAEGWHTAGRYKVWQSVTQGLENAPDAVNNLVSGGNRGKQLIQAGSDPTLG